MVSRNQDTCYHLAPKVATAPSRSRFSPVHDLHSPVNHGSPSKCQTCCVKRAPAFRKVSAKCPNASPSQIQSILVSKCFAGVAHEKKGEHGQNTSSQHFLAPCCVPVIGLSALPTLCLSSVNTSGFSCSAV